MRSIRRSLTWYLIVLLAVTLGVVWVVIDQVTARALAAREAAGADLIKSRYEAQCREELKRTDQALLLQARELGNLMRRDYGNRLNAELANHRRLMGAAQLMFLTNPLAEVAWTATGNSTGTLAKPNPGPGVLFRAYFANLPLPDDYIQHSDDETHGSDYHQINTLAGREWHSRSLVSRKLLFDPKDIDTKTTEDGKQTESTQLIDWVWGDVTLNPGGETVRRVLYKVPLFGGNIQFPGFRQPRAGPPREERREGSGNPGGGPGLGGGFTPQRSMVGAWAAWALTGNAPPAGFGFTGPPPTVAAPPPAPSPDSIPRLYIQCARPQAAIEAGMAVFAAERDDELNRLSGEIRDVRTTLRLTIGIVAILAFLGGTIGGWLIVGTGLRPIGKLSDAVSRVSERDFKLSHDGTGLVFELAPIHARLTQTLNLLQRAFTREKQAVADISHELRTPIAALMATIDVALRKTRTPEQYRTTLEECRLISKQLGQLVERIMTLACLDAGNDRTLISRTDAIELASGCAAMIRPLAANNGITVQLQTEEMIELDTDPGKLREVLMNLLHNAVEYNCPNGNIDLTVKQDDQTVVFEVRDTGIGMTDEVREKIFERFFRADPSRHATGVHAGLGLAIVKEYVARLNGTIAVESQVGVGSTFRLCLPGLKTEPCVGREQGMGSVSRPTNEPVATGT